MRKTFVCNGMTCNIDDRTEMCKEITEEIGNEIIDMIINYERSNEQAYIALKNLTYLICAEFPMRYNYALADLQDMIEDESRRVVGLVFIDDPDDMGYLTPIVKDENRYALYSIECYDCNKEIPRFELPEREDY